MSRKWFVPAIAVGLIAGAMSPRLHSADAPRKGAFASATIDLGVLVSDADKAVKFYTDALGFKEVKGFNAPAELVGDAGLTANKAFDVRVLVLDDSPSATKLKIIAMPGSKPKKGDTEFLDTQLGVRYLTIFVTDMDAAVKRAEKAGAKPIARGPVPLPKGFPEGVYLAVLRDPDGNMVELVGPKTAK